MKKEAIETQPCGVDSGIDSTPRHFPVTHFPVLAALERSFPVGVVFSGLAGVRRRLSGVGLEGWSEPRSIDVKRFVAVHHRVTLLRWHCPEIERRARWAS